MSSCPSSSVSHQQTVVVTGAGGFIGGHTARLLQARGWRVLATWHQSRPADLPEDVKLWRGDLSDESDVADLFSTAEAHWGRPPGVVVHCAGRASDIGRDAQFRRANFDAVRSVARATSQAAGRFELSSQALAIM